MPNASPGRRTEPTPTPSSSTAGNIAKGPGRHAEPDTVHDRVTAFARALGDLIRRYDQERAPLTAALREDGELCTIVGVFPAVEVVARYGLRPDLDAALAELPDSGIADLARGVWAAAQQGDRAEADRIIREAEEHRVREQLWGLVAAVGCQVLDVWADRHSPRHQVERLAAEHGLTIADLNTIRSDEVRRKRFRTAAGVDVWGFVPRPATEEMKPVAEPSDTPAPSPPPVPTPTADSCGPPFVPISGWPAIFDALNAHDLNCSFNLTEENKVIVRNLNEKYDGPILFGQKGERPTSDQASVQQWWAELPGILAERKAREDAAAATITETYQHGRAGDVVPGIGGHIKKRKVGKVPKGA